MMDTMSPTQVAPDTAATSNDELAARLRLGITRLARILRQQSADGLSPSQLAALATIERSGPMPIGTLAEVEQVAAPTATKVVEKLVAAGLVERVADGDDRRVKRVAVTAEGHRFLTRLRARKTAWLTTRLAELPADDIAALAGAVDVLERLAARPDLRPQSPEPTLPNR
jgi:DNA-binding MarR family transcriptional regulator